MNAPTALQTAGPPLRTSDVVAVLRDEAGDVDTETGFPVRSVRCLRDAGWLAPASFLGGAPALFDRLAAIGRGSLPVGRVYEGHVNALLLVEAYGTREQMVRFGADADDGHLFAVWNTEAGDGVRLKRSAGSVELRGSKTFATAAGYASRAIVTGDDANGQRWMVVVDLERADPALDRSFWRPLGMRPTASAKVDFTGVRVPADAVLGGPGDYYREPLFSTGSTRFAAVQQGGAEAVLDETRAFLRRVGHADDPYQRARLGEMAVCVASGRHWLAAASDRLQRKRGARESDIAFAHLMRSAIEAIGLRVLQLSERSVGARGLLRPEPFERLHRDLTHYLRQGAPDAALAAAGAHVLGRDQPFADLFAT